MSSRASQTLPPEAGWAALKQQIIAHSGHHYYEDKDAQLWERVRERMGALGIGDSALYLERLRDEAAGPREWRQLESLLTIKETFFFRFAEQFQALRTHILPALLEARATDRRLRIWSAGCSTGAEPYSLAVVLTDLLGAAIDDWTISILGTDIDETAVAQARDARFGGWALRTVAPNERTRMFEPEGSRWRLKLPWRAMVRFERQNILDLLGPAAPLQLDDYDLILCRNLLIYFHPDVASRLVAALGARLRPTGRLLLGHAETGLAFGTPLVAIEGGGVVAYGEGKEGAPSAPPIERRAPIRRLPRRPAKPHVAAPTPPPVDRLETIRIALSAGALDEAGALIEQARAERRDDPLLLYLAGLCASAARDPAAAEKAFRGALYLDGEFAMAHFMLGQALIAGGRASPGRRALQNAARAAEATPDAPLPEGEGWTGADLREAVRHRLDRDHAA